MLKYLPFFVILFFYHSNAQNKSIELHFVLFAEVYTQNCSGHEQVLFQSPFFTIEIENFAEKNNLIAEVKESYKTYIEELVNKEFPQYYLKDCIPKVSNWAFFEEWNTSSNIVSFRKTITANYSSIRIIDTDFELPTKTEVNPDISNPKIKPENTIVQAYYNEALKNYEQKNYAKTIDILHKANKILNGKVNLDIIMLEAKSRYQKDRNITKAKQLFNSFIVEGAKVNDDRIEEAASLLVQIETSEDFYNTGFRKTFETHTSENGEDIRLKYFLHPDGQISQIHHFKKNWGAGLFKIVDYNSDKGKRVMFMDKSSNLLKEEYYVDQKLHTEITNNKVAYYLKNNLIQHITYDTNKIHLELFKTPQDYQNNKSFFKIKNAEIESTFSFTPEPLQNNIELNLGGVQSLKLPVEKEEFYIYTFSKEGFPIQKKHYKKVGKIKAIYQYNSGTQKWIEI